MGKLCVLCNARNSTWDKPADGNTLKDVWDSEWLANLKADFLAGEKSVHVIIVGMRKMLVWKANVQENLKSLNII